MSIGQTIHALQAEAAAISASGDLAATSAISAAKVGIRIVAAPIADIGELTDMMVEQGKGPLVRVLLRLARPDLWLVYHIADQARHARRSLEKAIKVFDISEDVSYKQSADFMERLGGISWVA